MTIDVGVLALLSLLLPIFAFVVLAVAAPFRRLGRPAAYFSIACAGGSLLAAIMAWQGHAGGDVSRIMWEWLPAQGGPLATVGVLADADSTSELQSRLHLVCRLLLEKKKKT